MCVHVCVHVCVRVCACVGEGEGGITIQGWFSFTACALPSNRDGSRIVGGVMVVEAANGGLLCHLWGEEVGGKWEGDSPSCKKCGSPEESLFEMPSKS